MEFFERFSLTRIFVIMTGLTVFSFFILLIVANVTSRKGIEEIGSYQKDIRAADSKITELDSAIATYSSLVRIEKRAKEMGLTPAKKTEYLK
jgi:cell division protein FtsL